MNVLTYCRLILMLSIVAVDACCAIAKRRIYNMMYKITTEYVQENESKLTYKDKCNIKLDMEMKEFDLKVIISAIRFNYVLFVLVIILISLFI